MESELLRHLVRNDGKIVSRKQILEEVWGLHEDTDTRAIDNFVVRLRRYIEDDPANPRHLLTVRGVGYRFLAKPERAVETDACRDNLSPTRGTIPPAASPGVRVQCHPSGAEPSRKSGL